MSVARCKGDIKSAAWRIWGQIDEPADVLATEVARLGIYTRVIRPGLEVSPAQLNPQTARATEETPGKRGRQIVRERQLAKLHERAILHILRHAVIVVALRPQQAPIRLVWGKPKRIV